MTGRKLTDIVPGIVRYACGSVALVVHNFLNTYEFVDFDFNVHQMVRRRDVILGSGNLTPIRADASLS